MAQYNSPQVEAKDEEQIHEISQTVTSTDANVRIWLEKALDDLSKCINPPPDDEGFIPTEPVVSGAEPVEGAR